MRSPAAIHFECAFNAPPAEIQYWKQMCMHALRQAQELNSASEESRQRSNELEQLLATLLQNQQKEKEDRLSKWPINRSLPQIGRASCRERVLMPV